MTSGPHALSASSDRRRWSPAHAIWMAAIVTLLDSVTPAAVQLPMVYVVPVAFAAWFCGQRWALALSIVLPLVRMAVVVTADVPPWSAWITGTNVVIRLGVLLVTTYVVGLVSQQTARVRLLEGLLHTCAACKRVRDADGTWHQMERYISARTEARFSHTICPDCATRLYPDLLSDERDRAPS